MRTKTLLLTAVLGFAGVAASEAQQVYSVNAVGFVNLTITPGYNLISNPLDRPPNALSTVLAGVPEGTIFYKFVNGSYVSYTYEFGEWDPADGALTPGEGGFLRNLSGANFPITFVGEVRQSLNGPLTQSIPAGFSIQSSQVPQSLVLSDPAGGPDLDFPAVEGDIVYFYRNNGYVIHSFEFGEWEPKPIPGVGEAFFVRKISAGQWERTFTVNP